MSSSLIRKIYRGWSRNESFWDTNGMNENLRAIGDHLPLNIKHVGAPKPSSANEGDAWIDPDSGQYAVWSTGPSLQAATWNNYAPSEGLIGFSSSDGKMWGNTGSSWEDGIEMVVGSAALQTAIANSPPNLKNCDGEQILPGTEIATCEDLDAAISSIPSATVPDATETTKGKVELATTTEAVAGIDTTRAVTPAGLKAAITAIPSETIPDATETTKGKVELATILEATTGTDTTRAVTPAGLSAAISAAGTGSVPDATETVKGKVELATVAEALAGTSTSTVVTPAGVSAAIAGNAIQSATPPASVRSGLIWKNTGGFHVASEIPSGGIAMWTGTRWELIGGNTNSISSTDVSLAAISAISERPITTTLVVNNFGSTGTTGMLSGVVSFPSTGLLIKASGIYSITAHMTIALTQSAQLGLLIKKNNTAFLARQAQRDEVAASCNVSYTGFLAKDDFINVQDFIVSSNATSGTATVSQYEVCISRIA